jgi:hypothetical protein
MGLHGLLQGHINIFLDVRKIVVYIHETQVVDRKMWKLIAAKQAVSIVTNIL